MDPYQIGTDRPYRALHDMIEDDRKAVQPSGSPWSDVKKYRDYARGRQKGTLNADQVKVMAAILQHKFADNVLKLILETHANRIRLARFDVENEQVSQFLFTTWVKNSMPDLFADAIYAVLRDGNHALALNWKPSDDPGDPYGGYVSFSRERWWDGSQGVFVMYDDAGKPDYAVKEWTPVGRGAKKRRNIYFDNMIFRFVLEAEGWTIFNLDGDVLVERTGEEINGPVAWTKRDGSPLGVPIIHLANGSDDDTYYGASLLAGGPLAFQDQINAIQHDISAACMLNGSPQTFSKGFPQPPDPQDPTKKKPIRTGPGMHHHTDEATADWGTIPPGDLSQLDRGYFAKVNAVCRNTSTPLHTITGQWPSGEAIFRAEMPLVQSGKKLVESVGPSMSSAQHRATEIYNAFGRGPVLDERSLITAVFEPVEQRDELARWTVIEKAAPFVSEEEVLRKAGYSPDEITKIMDERQAAKERGIEQAQAVFNRGAELPLNGSDNPVPVEETEEE